MYSKISSPLYSSVAPALAVVEWLNTEDAIKLADLKGNVVVLHTFQMLCPSCVTHGIPQAIQLHNFYQGENVKVLGLHTVFEHKEIMTIEALKVFVSEYRIPFPIAVDKPAEPGQGLRPHTMKAYQLEGTPSLVIIDTASDLSISVV